MVSLSNHERVWRNSAHCSSFDGLRTNGNRRLLRQRSVAFNNMRLPCGSNGLALDSSEQEPASSSQSGSLGRGNLGLEQGQYLRRDPLTLFNMRKPRQDELVQS